MHATAADRQTAQGFSLARIAGIDIRLDYSWFIILALLIWSLSAGYFPAYLPGESGWTYLAAGTLAALLFFASLLAHELAHSLVAMRAGIRISSITLFVFGGMARLSEDVADPKTEIRVAIAGPIASFLLAAGFWLLRGFSAGAGFAPGAAIFGYLAWINVVLAAFNLFPGFPLDGGRVLRAVLWWRTGDVVRATKWASDMGKGFAAALMILGVFEFALGNFLGGLWLLFIGMFLQNMAAQGYLQILLRRSLEGVRVEEVMIREPVTVPPQASLEEVAEEYFLHHGFRGFPVADDGRVLGVISIQQVIRVPREERSRRRAVDAMVPLGERMVIEPGVPLLDAVPRMNEAEAGRLIVIRNGTMEGMITKTGLVRFLELKQLLT